MKTNTFTLLNKKQKINMARLEKFGNKWNRIVFEQRKCWSVGASISSSLHSHTYIHMYKSINAFVCTYIFLQN